jgi:hypothetical protein
MKDSTRESLRALRQFGKLVVVLVLIFIGLVLAEKQGWMFHDMMTNVASKGWEVGEYKSCFVSASRDETSMVCDADGLATRIFKVRFWGYLPASTRELKNDQWQCRRNDGNPALTCEKPAVSK